MLQAGDYVHHAFLWKKPAERYQWLRNQLPEGTDIGNIIKEYNYPKLYNTNIASYAVFINQHQSPYKVCNTRSEAWEVAQLKYSDSGVEDVYVVDAPNSESEKPSYDKYYTERVPSPVPSREEQSTQTEELFSCTISNEDFQI